MNKPKVLLIGWDAADWKIIGPLMAKGYMPALKKLVDRGVYGNMSTMNPPYSPMLWSSVATGKTPDKHGVLGFVELLPDMKGIRPVTATSRKTRAIWNILHNQGYRSNLVGWWPSFPAEPINGIIVSDKFQKVKSDPKSKNPIFEGTIHPKEMVDKLKDLRVFPYEITEAHVLPFIPKAAEIDQEKDGHLRTFAKILSENASIHSASTNIIRTTEWDFMAVYYDLIDHFCHAFMKFHPPKLKTIPQDLFEIYNEVVISAYRFQDMMLERTIELAGEDTTIIVMSDHGFESGHKRLLKMPKYPAAPSLEHRQFGIFVAAGPNIKKNEKVFGLSLIDVAPTILHMFNLPVGNDMDGKVALDIFNEPIKPTYIESWDRLKGDFGEHTHLNNSGKMDQEIMKQLIDLGYIEKPDERLEIAILKTSCDLKHNLARVFLGKKDHTKAKEILLELIKEEKFIDTIPFYMDLLKIALTENDFKNAEKYLKTLRYLDKNFEINTYFAESKILLGKGKIQKALNVLEKAKDNNPNSEVWYQIGKIYMQMDRHYDAKDAFENALEYEIDHAKFHQALAVVLLRLGENEAAAEHALTSIELVKYFPDAHYTLGEALEKLGDLENAKAAYEMASKLVPQNHYRAEKAIENLTEKADRGSLMLNDKANYKYREDQIVIVSGLPRSGTSLMMQMLDKGGIDVLIDDKRKSDESNPRGYYEYEPVTSIHKDNSWLSLAQNRSVKVVAPLLKFLSPKYRYKIIFMNRDLTEIIKSQQRMIGKSTDTLPLSLYESYGKLLRNVGIWKEQEPGVELIYIDYRDVIFDSEQTVNKLETFLGYELNKELMTKCVDTSLYRNRSK